jgi:hypothetical protein
VIRARVGRLGAVLAIGSLVALQAFAGTAGAAETRMIYVGYDADALNKNVPAADLEGNGHLAFTQVTAGGLTASSVYVRNTDNQTLTHVVISILKSQNGVTISLLNSDASKCPSSTDGLNWVCDFGNLKADATKSFTLLLQTGGAGTVGIVVRTTFNESNNPNGGNPQIEDVTGDLNVLDGACELGATYLLSGVTTDVDEGCLFASSHNQSTKISLAASANSAVFVKETSLGLCPTGVTTCFGQESVADVAVDGKYVVTWTIKWTVRSNFNVNQLVIYHFADGATVETQPDQTLTYKKNICKLPASSNCIVSAIVEGTILTAIVKTDGNGSMRGSG